MDRKEKKDEKGKELQEEGRRPDCVTTVCSLSLIHISEPTRL